MCILNLENIWENISKINSYRININIVEIKLYLKFYLNYMCLY